MQYDFESILNRHGQDAIAVDGLGQMPGMTPDAPQEGFDFIPMWVADMNFPVVPTIQDAIIARAKEPHFGYFLPRDEYFDEIIKWHETRNGVEGLTKECIGYENGVLGGVVSTLKSFMQPGDSVLLHSPTYIGFTGCIENAGFHIVHSPLVVDEGGTWRMDFDDMEKKLAENNIHAPPYSARRTTLAVACGSAGRSSAPWSFIGSTTAWWCRTRSGRTSSCPVISTSPRSPYPRTRAIVPWRSMRPARLSTWRAWWAATTSSTTSTCAIARRPRPPRRITTI